MAGLLVELADLESPSLVPESQQAIQEILTRRLEKIGFTARLFPGQETGGDRFLSRRAGPEEGPAEAPDHAAPAADGAPVQLLLGHTDTVWPIGTVGDMPVEWDEPEDIIRGPGVFDMKAGIVQMVFALEALSELGLEPTVAPTIFLNSDEEVGSPESRGHVEQLAQASSRVLVLEPALGPEGLIKTPVGVWGVSRFGSSVVRRTRVSRPVRV